jgi:DMSO/TMAO reductase YedYZ molybdopterin-dependent catalytic subunit
MSKFPGVISRRDLLGIAGRLSVAGAIAALGAGRATAQGSVVQSWNKERLIRRSVRPPDYETPVSLLDSFITPAEHFYVRSHLPVPAALDAATWTLAIGGEVAIPLSLTLDEIKMPTGRCCSLSWRSISAPGLRPRRPQTRPPCAC